MGRDKTDRVIGLGLKAKHVHLCFGVLPADLNECLDYGNVRIAAFNSRNNLGNNSWGKLPLSLMSCQMKNN